MYLDYTTQNRMGLNNHELQAHDNHFMPEWKCPNCNEWVSCAPVHIYNYFEETDEFVCKDCATYILNSPNNPNRHGI